MASSTRLIQFALLGILLFLLPGGLATSQDRVSVMGNVVDDETGKPITAMMIQAGKFDAKDPKKVTWGYSERTTSSKTGRFSTTVRWQAGWTARIVADGYIPHPVISEAPKLGATKVEVKIRLKKGKPVLGTVVDHKGNPVVGAKIFAVSPRGINLYDGNARTRYGDDKIDTRAKFVETDEKGQFQISAGGSAAIAVCAKTIDVLAVKVDPENEKPVAIKLPKPTRMTITYDIPGAEKETKVFYQLLTHLMDGYKRVESTRSFTIKKGESIELTSLPPGKYQFARQKMHRYGNVGQGAMLDRTFLEIKPGESKTLDFVRKSGKQIEGIVRWPKGTELAGVMLSVESIDAKVQPWSTYKNKVIYSSQLIAGGASKKVEVGEAAFKTESLLPGKYVVRVIAYAPMTPAEMRLSGIRMPDFDTITKEITVTESNAPNMLIINLLGKKKVPKK